MAYLAMEDALCSLLPTHKGILPSPLVQLSASLVAQSRTKASNLRVEEEIARTYLCAHIACERLKTSLNLPTITPRPPCPPKIYSQLFEHFTVLLAPRRRGRPRKEEQRPPPSPVEPSPPPVSAPIRPLRPINYIPTPHKSHGLKPAPEPTNLPNWIPSAVRHVCHAIEAPLAIPHVLAGVATILTPSDSETRNGTGKRDKEGALIIAVSFFVFMRLMDMQTTGEEYVALRASAIRALEGQITAHGDQEVVEASDVDTWIKEISEAGWEKEAWFENIEAASGVVGQEEPVEDEAGAIVEAEDVGAGQMASGLGTMMQDKVDYLSEAKRRDYKQWKASVLARVTEIERQSQTAI